MVEREQIVTNGEAKEEDSPQKSIQTHTPTHTHTHTNLWIASCQES